MENYKVYTHKKGSTEKRWEVTFRAKSFESAQRTALTALRRQMPNIVAKRGMGTLGWAPTKDPNILRRGIQVRSSIFLTLYLTPAEAG